jgi:hypothetical protein
MWMLNLSPTALAQSGESCEFEKIEEIEQGVYLVDANCQGQSGITGTWTDSFEIGHYIGWPRRPSGRSEGEPHYE